jgi:hypothetical protein
LQKRRRPVLEGKKGIATQIEKQMHREMCMGAQETVQFFARSVPLFGLGFCAWNETSCLEVIGGNCYAGETIL